MSFYEYMNGLHEVYKQKNKAYGNSAHDSFVKYGAVCYITRLSDKLNRFKTLSENKDIDRADESIKDTVNDAVTYTIMFLADIMNPEKYEEIVHDMFDRIAKEGLGDEFTDKYKNPEPAHFIELLDLAYDNIKEKMAGHLVITLTKLLTELVVCGYTL